MSQGRCLCKFPISLHSKTIFWHSFPFHMPYFAALNKLLTIQLLPIMRKILISACAVLLTAGMAWGQEETTQEDVLIVKPGGVYVYRADGTDGKDYPWSSADAKTSDKYRMKKVEGTEDLYQLTMTLDRCFRTSKWEAKWGETAPAEGRNEGWMNLYGYRVVFEDEYDGATNMFRMFEVPADGTEVTFYAKVVTGKDGEKSIRAVCDAQDFSITQAGAGQGDLPAAIGELFTSKAYDLDEKEAVVNAKLGGDRCDSYKGTSYSDFGGKFNVRDGEPGRKAQGRGIITVHYETVSLSVEKTIDAIQDLNATIGNYDLTTINGVDLGAVESIPVSGALNTVILRTGYPLLNAISEENTQVNLCYTIAKTGVEETEEAEVLKKSFTLTGEPTNLSASWELANADLLEGLGLEDGTYALSFWFESEYTAEYGKDTIVADNASVPYQATFMVEGNGSPTTGLDVPALQAHVTTQGQTICAAFDGTATVKLYALNGQLLDSQVAAGEYTYTASAGLYLLEVDGTTYKVAIR